MSSAFYAPGGLLEKALAEGTDLHAQTAERLGVDRDTAKRINFAMPYGAGTHQIAQIIGCELDRGKAVLDRWYATYPEVKRLQRRLERRVTERGYVESLGGRRHYFEGPSHRVMSHLVQGTGAELLKRSLVQLHARDVPIVLIVLIVHDELVAEVPEEDAEVTGQLLVEALTSVGKPKIRLVAEAEAHKRWSAFKDPNFAPEAGDR